MNYMLYSNTSLQVYLSAVKLLAPIPRHRHQVLALLSPPVAAVRAHVWISRQA
jgi:hypothetical protein